MNEGRGLDCTRMWLTRHTVVADRHLLLFSFVVLHYISAAIDGIQVLRVLEASLRHRSRIPAPAMIGAIDVIILNLARSTCTSS